MTPDRQEIVRVYIVGRGQLSDSESVGLRDRPQGVTGLDDVALRTRAGAGRTGLRPTPPSSLSRLPGGKYDAWAHESYLSTRRRSTYNININLSNPSFHLNHRVNINHLNHNLNINNRRILK